MPSILLTNYYSDKLIEVIKSVTPKPFKLITLKERSQEEIIRKIPCADYLLVGGRLKIDKKVLEAASKLKMIQRTGVGLDSLDLKEINKRNIAVYVNHGVNSKSVSEHTILLILSVLRNVTQSNYLLKSGKWVKHDLGIQNNDLHKKTIGLIGLGNIGKEVAKRLKGFEVNILYNKRNRLTENDEEKLGVQFVPIETMLKNSDIISLHCPLNIHTEKMIGSKEFSQMKNNAIIINTSRGKLIDEKALIIALKSKAIKGAGLDVFEHEPLDRKNELINMDNVIITPHIGGITHEAFGNMMKSAFKNIKLFEEGKFKLIEDKKINQ